MNPIHPIRRTVALTLAVLSGCQSFGPEQLRGTHPLYNAAIVDSINGQFLSNLVRLHYRDPTFFLDVASVAATVRLGMKGDAGANFDASQSGNIGFGGSYEIYPTVSYAPLQGEEFVKSLLSPVSIDAVLALTGSGWSVRRVFALCVESINGIANAPTASGPTPEQAPKHYKEWNRLTDIFERVADENLIQARQDPETKTLKIEIRSTPEYADVISELKGMLGLDPRMTVYRVEGDAIERRSDTIHIVTRPLMGTLFYLSHRIDSPVEDQTAGYVTVTRNPDGSVFDWGDTPAGRIFHVRQSDDRPDHAFQSINFYDRWYYIPNNDLESKSTFLLLTQLFRLQAGAAKSIGPTLTIPVR
ncbi:MAG: hypothetical protein RL661_159 [Pseudomonadota bacterium]|jgi:hypothetical protein